MSLQIALQMDALDALHVELDSTLYLARAAAKRGHRLFHYTPQHLRMEIKNGKRIITALGNELTPDPSGGHAWVLGEAVTRDLTEFNIVLMRQDPPFDLAYITATHILEHLAPKTRVINDPVGVRNAPEKLLITHFPELMPPTLITRDLAAIEAFRAEHQDIVIKPLHGHAGHGVFHLRPGDDNLAALTETMAGMNHEPWMIQKFLHIHELGDKRIVMLNGEPAGSYKRIPAKGDMRGNMRVGATAEASPLTPRDVEICKKLGPVLRERGLFLCGLDVIGDALTEINVTSPTGLVVADEIEGRSGKNSIAEQFWNLVER
jgi:glutathione synthase